MNVKLLRKVKKHILEEPRRFVMGVFADKQIAGRKTFIGDDGTRVKYAECGTAACIGGWAVYLGGDPSMIPSHSDAKRVLGLAHGEDWRLFYPDSWPVQFHSRYSHAETQAERATIAAERIDHFIATKGAE